MRRYIRFGLLRWAVASMLFIAVILLPWPANIIAGASSASAPTVVSRSDAEVFYLASINRLRAERNMPALVIDSRLSQSAAQKTDDMITQHYWAHYSPNGRAFSDYIWQTSPKAARVGENLAKCFTTRQDAFAALVASPTHYEIMIGTFTNFGVAEAVDPGSGCLYTTMHFADYEQ